MKQIRFTKDELEKLVEKEVREKHGSDIEIIQIFTHTAGVVVFVKEEE